ncbi:MAG: hypothetical protein VR76_07900 [Pseudomonas sp. BRH_c35]|nr:MAG: hypothetical protein VR76_07900 [Pseudomonas sp. BRH_c35]
MRKPGITLDTQAAMAYIGESVLMELYMDEDEPPYWCCVHIVGVVLEKEGVWDYPYFMAMSFTSDGRTPSEIPFMDILTIRVMRHRDRHGSGNVLDRIALPNAGRSGAALPARRDSFTVPSNGSTGAAHP